MTYSSAKKIMECLEEGGMYIGQTQYSNNELFLKIKDLTNRFLLESINDFEIIKNCIEVFEEEVLNEYFIIIRDWAFIPKIEQIELENRTEEMVLIINKTKKILHAINSSALDNYIKSLLPKHINNFVTSLEKFYDNNTPTNDLVNPFRDNETQELFEYIVKNWSNNSASKWGYIWEFMFTKGNGKMTYKTEYETFLKTKYKFTQGKPNYDSCNSERRFGELEKLKDDFKKII